MGLDADRVRMLVVEHEVIAGGGHRELEGAGPFRARKRVEIGDVDCRIPDHRRATEMV